MSAFCPSQSIRRAVPREGSAYGRGALGRCRAKADSGALSCASALVPSDRVALTHTACVGTFAKSEFNQHLLCIFNAAYFYNLSVGYDA